MTNLEQFFTNSKPNARTGQRDIIPSGVKNRNVETISADKISAGTIDTSIITISDENGTTVIDGQGVVGSNSFTPNVTEKTNDQSITGDAEFQDVTGLSFTGLTFSRDVPVLFFGDIHYNVSGDDAVLYTQISDGTNAYPGTTLWADYQYVPDATTTYLRFHFTQTFTIPQGTTVLKVQCARSTPDETINVNGLQTYQRSTFGYLVLGK